MQRPRDDRRRRGRVAAKLAEDRRLWGRGMNDAADLLLGHLAHEQAARSDGEIELFQGEADATWTTLRRLSEVA
jgi:hypothetical protein